MIKMRASCVVCWYEWLCFCQLYHCHISQMKIIKRRWGDEPADEDAIPIKSRFCYFAPEKRMLYYLVHLMEIIIQKIFSSISRRSKGEWEIVFQQKQRRKMFYSIPKLVFSMKLGEKVINRKKLYFHLWSWKIVPPWRRRMQSRLTHFKMLQPWSHLEIHFASCSWYLRQARYFDIISSILVKKSFVFCISWWVRTKPKKKTSNDVDSGRKLWHTLWVKIDLRHFIILQSQLKVYNTISKSEKISEKKTRNVGNE